MRKKTLNTLLLILLSFIIKVNAGERKIIAYVTSWSNVKPDPFLMPHINYAFGHVSKNFNSVRIDNETRLKEIVSLKKINPKLKVLLSIGGWGSGNFSEMAANPTLRLSFARDCASKVKEFGLDGIDIDWEYPTSKEAGISSSLDDTGNFTLLMKDIRNAIGKKKLLTLATAAEPKYINLKSINPFINFVNIMTYDMASPPFHHAGLYKSNFTQNLSVEESIIKHFNAGIPYHKLVMGIPFYGRGTKEVGDFIDYRNIVNLKDYKRKWDNTSKAPYLVDTDNKFVCTYEDKESIKLKCDLIKKMGLLGGMYWDYAGDTDNQDLAKAVYNSLL
ncbi:glycoside hydrolase family 18 protein [Pseudopedobacter beijingensis]|uniref:chitinase n=1 Tax=Pseudopedobacter beijingensis TaxID=1207056 RepID=A0ABW4IER0_9SPHI